MENQSNATHLHQQLEALQRNLAELTEHNQQLHQEISHHAAKAEAAGRAKDQFLATISHEIRTPMNAILGMSHLALNTDLDPRQHGYISKVHRSAEDLLRIVNDVLDFSQIKSGKLVLERSSFQINEVLATYCDLLGLKAEDKGLEFLLDAGTQLPNYLIGDAARLSQVLHTLGDNAVKFTDQGELVLGIREVERTDDEVMLHFWLKDTGIGIAPEQQSQLFQSFWQAESANTRRYGGTGMGLAVAKRLVDLMGGSLQVESEPGKGSTFHFTARFGLQQDPQEDRTPAHDFEGLRMLIVDDNASAREILEHMGAHFGFQVQASDGGLQALRTIELARQQGQPFDIVLMDWKMPDLDGVQTVKRMRQSMVESVPAVVMVTAYGRDVVLRNATAVDVNLHSVLTKPVTPALLFEAIHIALGREHIRGRKLARPADTLPQVCAKLHGARLLLVEDNALNQELAVELLHQQGIQCEIANNGQEALDWLARDSRFDGVLMDCQMPVMDGYTATQRIRQNPAFAQLPIIAMTANAMLGDKEKSKAAGMNDHIAKPINVLDMFTTMARWISVQAPAPQANTLAATALGAPSEAHGIPALPGIDIARGLAITLDNTALYRRLLLRFGQEYASFADDFLHACRDSAPDTATRLAHTLKGCAGNIGALGVQHSAAALEQACAEHTDTAVIHQLALETVSALRPVLKGLQVLHTPAPPKHATPSRQVTPSPALMALYAALRDNLQESDADALPQAEQLAEALAGTAWEAHAQRICTEAQAFAFEDALALLEALAQACLHSAETVAHVG